MTIKGAEKIGHLEYIFNKINVVLLIMLFVYFYNYNLFVVSFRNPNKECGLVIEYQVLIFMLDVFERAIG